jgi:putative pyruvate formate lyase activating enzyme
VARLREIYFELIDQGVHNINLVNPTHFSDAILESLEGGLPVPVVWNSGGYEKVENIRRFDGKIQVYLPDLKYIDPESARKYSAARNYFEYAGPALKEMLRQTGPVELNEDGIIRRGTIVRHLILPGLWRDSIECVRWLHETFGEAIYISLMNQYMPLYKAARHPEINRPLMTLEYQKVVRYARSLGITHAFIQVGLTAQSKFIPDFNGENVLAN